jgi:RNA polymerase I-specific transcription initiation factor RRN6
VLYLEKEIKFFQLWTLSTDLQLSSTLCVLQDLGYHGPLPVLAPSIRIHQSTRRFGSRVAKDSFIVPDNQVLEEGEHPSHRERRNFQLIHRLQTKSKQHEDIRLGINFRSIFLHIFNLNRKNKVENKSPDTIFNMDKLLNVVLDRLRHGIEEDALPLTTFAEISGLTEFAEDLEQATIALHKFVDSLEADQTADTTSKLVLTYLTTCPDDKISPDLKDLKDLQGIYNEIADYWMASAPLGLSNLARLAKYKILCHVAVDLCLSSIGINLQRRTINPMTIEPSVNGDGIAESIPAEEISTAIDSSPALFQSQLASIPDQESPFLLTPARTPSIYSHATSGSELTENPTITRLRQYAISIKANADLGQPALLSHWPSTPGTDPTEYSWEAAQNAIAAQESGVEDNHGSRKEEVRRRRRTEKFLRQQRSRVVEKAASQAVAIAPGTQPYLVPPAFSSQTVDELPMTQPDRGTFGSRAAQKGKKKVKKPRTAGFK